MDRTEIIIIVTSIIIAIFMLLIYNNAMTKKKYIVWPPVTRNCPDNWTEEEGTPGLCKENTQNGLDEKCINTGWVEENNVIFYSYLFDESGKDVYGNNIHNLMSEPVQYAYFNPDIKNIQSEKNKINTWLNICGVEWEGVKNSYYDRDKKTKGGDSKWSSSTSIRYILLCLLGIPMLIVLYLSGYEIQALVFLLVMIGVACIIYMNSLSDPIKIAGSGASIGGSAANIGGQRLSSVENAFATPRTR